jgi:late competence protein required for DNA uptake (superfamily II DNA/RNA helicase)
MKCLRCLRDSAQKIAEAPDGSKAWEVYYCDQCNYVWRSTEEEEVLNIELRDQFFQMDKKDLNSIQPNNPIPPLLKD